VDVLFENSGRSDRQWVVRVQQQIRVCEEFLFVRGVTFLTLVAVFLTLGTAEVTRASQATPTPPACDIDPLNPEQLEDIVAAGPGEPGTLKPTGQPVSAELLVDVFRVITDSVDCANANDPLRSMALYSDRYLATRFAGSDGEDELGHLIAAASREPVPAAPEDRLVLLGITETVTYDDGRVGVMVTTANADSVFADLVILIQTDDGWRIDQVVLDAGNSQPGTPRASSQDRPHLVG
jgi:hypothetical protein